MECCPTYVIPHIHIGTSGNELTRYFIMPLLCGQME